MLAYFFESEVYIVNGRDENWYPKLQRQVNDIIVEISTSFSDV